MQSVCDYLASPNGTIYIENNASGCNSQQEVEDACDAIGIPNINVESEVLIFPNPAEKNLYLKHRWSNY
ncbi:MAG: hypothetical protein K8S00_05490 [Bacteroidales bacterium]|nr:hypothetical protein [Bacteroidales bacterium]